MLHEIDQKKSKWSDIDLERLMVFCLLDRAMPYENVCKVFNWIDKLGLTTREGIKNSDYDQKTLGKVLSCEGTRHRFPNQTAKFIWAFADSTYDLRTITRDELVNLQPGLGYKLASMYLRNTRGEEYAVIDIHIKRWLEEHGHNPNAQYKKLEQIFLDYAHQMGKSAYQLDMEIWETRRIGNRKKSK